MEGRKKKENIRKIEDRYKNTEQPLLRTACIRYFYGMRATENQNFSLSDSFIEQHLVDSQKSSRKLWGSCIPPHKKRLQTKKGILNILTISKTKFKMEEKIFLKCYFFPALTGKNLWQPTNLAFTNK